MQSQMTRNWRNYRIRSRTPITPGEKSTFEQHGLPAELRGRTTSPESNPPRRRGAYWEPLALPQTPKPQSAHGVQGAMTHILCLDSTCNQPRRISQASRRESSRDFSKYAQMEARPHHLGPSLSVAQPGGQQFRPHQHPVTAPLPAEGYCPAIKMPLAKNAFRRIASLLSDACRPSRVLSTGR